MIDSFSIDSVILVNEMYHVLEGERGVCSAVSRAAPNGKFANMHEILSTWQSDLTFCGSCENLYSSKNPVYNPDAVRNADYVLERYLIDKGDVNLNETRRAMEFLMRREIQGTENWTRVAHAARSLAKQYLNGSEGKGKYAPRFLSKEELHRFTEHSSPKQLILL